jgi:hypothetical protein
MWSWHGAAHMIVIIVSAGKHGLHYYSPRIDKERKTHRLGIPSRGCCGSSANETFPRMETTMLSTEMHGVGQTSVSSYSAVVLELYYRVLQELDQQGCTSVTLS